MIFQNILVFLRDRKTWGKFHYNQRSDFLPNFIYPARNSVKYKQNKLSSKRNGLLSEWELN
jgi:hypothetical protein